MQNYLSDRQVDLQFVDQKDQANNTENTRLSIDNPGR